MSENNLDAFAHGGDADQPVSAEQLAAYEFKPFSLEDVQAMIRDFSMPKFAEEFGEHGVALRLATAMLRTTKEEMVENTDRMERAAIDDDAPGPTAEILDSMRRSRKRLSELVQLLQAAELRLASAAAVLELRYTGDAA